jgi:hypothetical protein
VDNEFAVANQVTTTYVGKCLGKGSSLRRAAAELVLPDTYSKSYASYAKLTLARPLFVDHDEITAFADDLTAPFSSSVRHFTPTADKSVILGQRRKPAVSTR